jgi:hypothetical protein
MVVHPVLISGVAMRSFINLPAMKGAKPTKGTMVKMYSMQALSVEKTGGREIQE